MLLIPNKDRAVPGKPMRQAVLPAAAKAF